MLDYTAQVFALQKQDVGGMSPLATGVLLKNEDGHFLVTARHVCNQLGTQGPFIPLSTNNFLQLSGKWKYIEMQRLYHNIDVAVLKLEYRLIPHVLTTYNLYRRKP
jgi:hypothetical protein